MIAALRSVVLGLVRAAWFENIAADLREIGWLGGAIAFLGLSPGLSQCPNQWVKVELITVAFLCHNVGMEAQGIDPDTS